MMVWFRRELRLLDVAEYIGGFFLVLFVSCALYIAVESSSLPRIECHAAEASKNVSNTFVHLLLPIR
jgi:hypothetical protein